MNGSGRGQRVLAAVVAAQLAMGLAAAIFVDPGRAGPSSGPSSQAGPDLLTDEAGPLTSVPAPVEQDGRTVSGAGAEAASPSASSPLPARTSPATGKQAAQRAVADVPAGIDQTGVADACPALQRFLQGVPPNTTVRFPEGARYRCESGVQLERRSGLVIEGRGAVLFANTTGAKAPPTPGFERNWPRNRTLLRLQDSGRVEVRGLRLVGPNRPGGPGSYDPALEAQHGLELWRTKRAVIEDVEVRTVHGDGFSVSNGSAGVELKGNRVFDTGRQGIAVTNAKDVAIVENLVERAGRSVFDLETDVASQEVRRVRIEHNLVRGGGGQLVAIYGAGPNVGDISIVGNRAEGIPLVIVNHPNDDAPRRGFLVEGNKSDVVFGSPLAPIRFHDATDVVIRGNFQPIAETQSRSAVYLERVCAWGVSANRFPGALPPIVRGSPGDCAFTNRDRQV